MALTTSLGTATMQVDLGLEDADIAELNVYSTVLSAIGCIVGGWLGDRLGLRKMIAFFYGLTALPVLYLALTLSRNAGIDGLATSDFYAAYLAAATCMGLHYGISAAVFMGLTNPAVAATQFTAFMSLKNLTIAYTNGWQGVVADASGYSTVLYIDAVLVLAPLLVLPFMAPRKPVAAARAPAAAPLPEAG
jgi:PAT family beta-lactamase induction signal transducer AmpG